MAAAFEFIAELAGVGQLRIGDGANVPGVARSNAAVDERRKATVADAAAAKGDPRRREHSAYLRTGSARNIEHAVEDSSRENVLRVETDFADDARHWDLRSWGSGFGIRD